MPNKGWEGTAQFPVAWFTHGFNLPSDIVYDGTVGTLKALFRLQGMDQNPTPVADHLLDRSEEV